MGFAVSLLLVLHAAPAVAPGSECASELTQALGALDGAGVTVSVGPAPKHELTASRRAGQKLSRELGAGTCDEVARATSVVIERWLQSLAPGATPPPPLFPGQGKNGNPPLPTGERVGVRGDTPDAGNVTRIAATTPVTFPAPDAGNVTRIAEALDAGQPATTPVTFPSPDAGNVTRIAEALDGGSPASTPVTLPAPDAGNVTPIVEAPDAGNVTSTDPLLATIGTAPPPLERAPEPPPPPSRPLRIDVTRFEALAGGGVVFPSLGTPLSPVITADLALTFNSLLRISLLGLFDFGGTQLVLDERSQVRGQFTTRGGVIAPTVQLCFGETWRVCGGALVGARIVEGTASGSFVFAATTARSGAFTLGPDAHVSFHLGAFEAMLAAELLVTPSPPLFVVTGLGDLTPVSTVQGLVRLAIGLGSQSK